MSGQERSVPESIRKNASAGMAFQFLCISQAHHFLKNTILPANLLTHFFCHATPLSGVNVWDFAGVIPW